MFNLRAPAQGFGRALDVAWHLVLPATALGMRFLALIHADDAVEHVAGASPRLHDHGAREGVARTGRLARHGLPMRCCR
jgi:hypothetical protein